MATSTPHAFSFGQIGSRKRPAGGDGERDASKVPKMQTPAPSATANGNDELDLVYPFWLQNGSTGGGGGSGSGGNPSLNPPFLDPNGPLAVQNNLLKVNTAAPITVASKALTLSYDPESLELTNQQQLAVKIDPEGPLKTTTEGIQLSVDPTTLEVDDVDWELTVKLDPNGPLDSSATGITVKVDDTLLVEDDGSGQGKELGVHLNPDGPITADQNGLDLEIDNQTLKITPGSAGGVLSVQLKPQGGLNSQSDGIQVVTQNSIEVDNGALDVKVVANGPLSTTPNGLTLNYDTGDFTVNAGTLSILRNPSLVANAYLTSGARTLQQFTAKGENSSQFSFPCAYYLQQWLSDGLIFSSLYLKLDRTRFTGMSSDPSYQNARYFTFWVGGGAAMNLSQLSTPTITPSTTEWTAFAPALNYSGAPAFVYDANPVFTIYFQPNTGRVDTYLPVLTGDWKTSSTYNPGTITLVVRNATIQLQSQSTFTTSVCYNFRCQNSGIFNNNATSGTLTLGPIFYSCPALSTADVS